MTEVVTRVAGEDALQVLEFGEVLDWVASRAVSDLGREAILARRPVADPARVRGEMDRVAEVMRFLSQEEGFVPPSVPDVRGALKRLRTAGGVLEPSQLHSLGQLLSQARELQGGLTGAKGEYPTLRVIRDALYIDPSLEKRIGQVVDAEGQILDSASKDLKRIRSDLRRAHGQIVRKLEKYLATLPDRFRVPDASVTVRDSRYVVPVRREGKGEVGGIVHDESGTGATLFVEPPLAVQLMNELRELERAEAREVQRILREVSQELRPMADALEGDQETLVAFDALYARARAGVSWGGHAPEVGDPDDGVLRIREGRHPLLVIREEGRVVPFDLELDPEERVLVVSGPNTGGKSVFLKSVGLLTLLVQAGIIPPVGKGTLLPVARRVYTDIGDRQSISESLSTFSAHLERLREIVETAGPGSLVLIDEMGTGTDPAEGAALARAALERLVESGARVLATSHLGALKTLDAPGSGIVNASLQFDADRMEPTYHLVKGRPGRSYGLAIARRTGMPGELVSRAEGYLDSGEASLEDLLERLEEQEARARSLTRELEEERTQTGRLRAELLEREVALREAERTAELRAREDARKLLLEAREEVEEAIREVRIAGSREMEEATRSARSRVEAAAREHRRKVEAAASARNEPVEVEEGDRVKILGSGTTGTVAEVRDGKATVEAGALRLQVALSELTRVSAAGGARESDPAVGAGARGRAGRRGGPGGPGQHAGAPKVDTSSWTGPDADVHHEVDLRGMRVDEATLEVARAIDGAVLGGLGELRIIHGKGTGALRQAVGEVLDRDSRVASHRMGGVGEGGAGVTVATLR